MGEAGGGGGWGEIGVLFGELLMLDVLVGDTRLVVWCYESSWLLRWCGREGGRMNRLSNDSSI